jgi:hypothetical protein
MVSRPRESDLKKGCASHRRGAEGEGRRAVPQRGAFGLLGAHVAFEEEPQLVGHGVVCGGGSGGGSTLCAQQRSRIRACQRGFYLSCVKWLSMSMGRWEAPEALYISGSVVIVFSILP